MTDSYWIVLRSVAITFGVGFFLLVAIWPVWASDRFALILRNLVMLPIIVLVRVPLMLALKSLAAPGNWADDALEWVSNNIPGWRRR